MDQLVSYLKILFFLIQFPVFFVTKIVEFGENVSSVKRRKYSGNCAYLVL